jgi:hypothetical protein
MVSASLLNVVLLNAAAPLKYMPVRISFSAQNITLNALKNIKYPLPFSFFFFGKSGAIYD